ncbi:hypothetical protein ABKN59_001673 [Abortiporus biennis]
MRSRKLHESPSSDPSDEDQFGGSVTRRRSTRACDQCRRMKSKCEPANFAGTDVCQACMSLGIDCTFVGPSHKRGPPKGYILAMERRLAQVEGLLGAIITSGDCRARSLVRALSKDRMAESVMNRVRNGPFGGMGRIQPYWSTKEDLMSSIITDGSLTKADNLAFSSPDQDWHIELHNLISETASPSSSPTSSVAPFTNVYYDNGYPYSLEHSSVESFDDTFLPPGSNHTKEETLTCFQAPVADLSVQVTHQQVPQVAQQNSYQWGDDSLYCSVEHNSTECLSVPVSHTFVVPSMQIQTNGSFWCADASSCRSLLLLVIVKLPLYLLSVLIDIFHYFGVCFGQYLHPTLSLTTTVLALSHYKSPESSAQRPN